MGLGATLAQDEQSQSNPKPKAAETRQQVEREAGRDVIEGEVDDGISHPQCDIRLRQKHLSLVVQARLHGGRNSSKKEHRDFK